MKEMRKCFKKLSSLIPHFFLFEEDGQAVVEYVLMVVFALGLVALIATGFRKTILKLWIFYIRQVSAACPGCPPDPTYRY